MSVRRSSESEGGSDIRICTIGPHIASPMRAAKATDLPANLDDAKAPEMVASRKGCEVR
jgi:hypothetical protein